MQVYRANGFTIPLPLPLTLATLSFDHLVRPHSYFGFRFGILDCSFIESRYPLSPRTTRWDRQADLLGRFQINDELKFCWPLNR